MSALICRVFGHRWRPGRIIVLSEWPLHEGYREPRCARCGLIRKPEGVSS